MAEVICPENDLIPIDPAELLDHVMKMKKQDFRLSQACAAYVDKKFELSYSFALDDGSYKLKTLRIVIDPETEISSITELYPYAFLYENEMKELFGVKIRMINLDYDNKLYRIRQETPLKVDRPVQKKPVPPAAKAAAQAVSGIAQAAKTAVQAVSGLAQAAKAAAPAANGIAEAPKPAAPAADETAQPAEAKAPADGGQKGEG